MEIETSTVKTILEQAIASGVFPGGVLLIAQGPEIIALIPAGRLTYDPVSPEVTSDTIYDLASLTKILSTTFLTMIFVDQGRLSLDTTLPQVCSTPVPADKRELTLAHLLNHASGWPAWRPFYEFLLERPDSERRSAVAAAILSEPFEVSPGSQAIYSDLNFILLGLILENLGSRRQDDLFSSLIADPLGLTATGYRPVDKSCPNHNDRIAPTEDVPRRGGVLRGVVHDDNAAALTGVAGHAGLFGRAFEVWRIFDELRRAWRGENRLVSTSTVEAFLTASPLAPDSTRAMGFDRPSLTDSSTGRFFSRASVGHLGFTGTSLWYDPRPDLTIILLTNRVHPTAENQAIRAFRPRLHDLVVETVSSL